MENSDIIVIGSGIAGLSFSIKLAELRKDLSITIFTKSEDYDSNTRYAQGGIAGVFNLKQDSFQSHIQDTLQSGGGRCNAEIVKKIIYTAPDRIVELEKWGVNFSKNQFGQKEVALEGGHSSPRIVHVKDATGNEIEKVLIKKLSEFPNISIFKHFQVIEIDAENEVIKGVKVLNTISNTLKNISACVVVLSTGGCGQLFKYTTNPEIATGDGVILAQRVGAIIKNMNFIQFHPTAFYEENKSPLFLISEAVRGAGAHIVNDKGERFVFNYDKRGELATRDVVTRAILNELREKKLNHVFLDCRHLNIEKFRNSFPNILTYCQSKGIDLKKDLIPIIPAAHYQCGGIEVNEFGETKVKNLFAIGECSNTGMHGKNRLASNSLLEALAFAHFAADKIAKQHYPHKKSHTIIDEKLTPLLFRYIGSGEEKEDLIFIKISSKLKEIMYKYAMIGSPLDEIKKGIKAVEQLNSENKLLLSEKSFSLDKCKLLNAFQLSKLILKQMEEELKKEKSAAEFIN